MARPRQIIYPLKYLARRESDEPAVFDARLARFLGNGVRVALLGRARAGIWLLAKFASSPDRNRVVMSPYTIPDLVNMVRFAGGDPVFVDVAPRSTNVDPEDLLPLLDSRVCCVFLTHYHFNQAALTQIRAECHARDILLFDDCALALGAFDQASRIGGTTDASVFSFSGFKTLNYFWGGAISTSSVSLASKVSAAVNTWSRLRTLDYVRQARKLMKYDFATRGGLFAAITFPVLRRMVLKGDNKEILPLVRVESEILEPSITSRPSVRAENEWSRKLHAVDGMIAARQRIAEIYDQKLLDKVVANETPRDIRIRSCVVNYPIIVDPTTRTVVYKDILARGFDVGLSLYPNVHEIAGFEGTPGTSRNVSRLVRSVITLPTHPRISESYAVRLADAVYSAIRSAT